MLRRRFDWAPAFQPGESADGMRGVTPARIVDGPKRPWLVLLVFKSVEGMSMEGC